MSEQELFTGPRVCTACGATNVGRQSACLRCGTTLPAGPAVGAPDVPSDPGIAAGGTPAAAAPAAAWARTHVVPAGGLRAWAAPHPEAEVRGDLAAGVEVRVIQWRADWAQVDASNGWWGWVDGRRLVPQP